MTDAPDFLTLVAQNLEGASKHDGCDDWLIENRHEMARRLVALSAADLELRALAERIERLAFTLWSVDADRAAPNVGRHRTLEQFAEEAPATRNRWLCLAAAAITDGAKP